METRKGNTKREARGTLDDEKRVREALQQARAGKFATDAEVEAAYAAFGKPGRNDTEHRFRSY